MRGLDEEEEKKMMISAEVCLVADNSFVGGRA
jgi:hypothetical protein